MQENSACKVALMAGTKPKLFAFNWEFLTQTLRIMKLTAIFLLAAVLQVSAKGFAQEEITISVNNAPLQQVLNSIEKQSGYYFIYRQEMLSDKKISISITKATLKEALDKCLKPQKLTYNIVGKSIVIGPSQYENSITTSDEADKEFPFIDVKGRVVNEKGEPVEGVSITVKGTNVSTATNSNGEFSLSTIDQNAILVFTHVSMETFELKVSGRSEIAISLKAKITALGDVQVVANTGYQTVKPNEVTGSINVVSEKTLNQQVGSNILARLDGVAASVIFPKQNLQNGPNFMIRGLSTINGPKNPLIVVDNFPYEGNINNINPNDIESITILKDAAATAIWGASRGANGVIVITTKKGRLNQPLKVNLNTNVIITEEPDLSSLRTISSSDYIDVESFLFGKGYYNSFLDNTSSRPGVSPIVEILAKRKAGLISSTDSAQEVDALRNVDVKDQYSKYMYRQAVTQQYALNLSGGSGNLAYYLSAGYDKAIDQLSADNNRLTFRSDNIYKPIKDLSVSLGVQYTSTKSSSGKPSYGSILVNQQWRIPYLQFADADGNPLAVAKNYRDTYTDTAGAGKLLDWKYYPLEDWKHNTTKVSTQDLLANVGLNYKLLDALSFDIKYQYERQNAETRNLQDLQSYDARDLINRFSQLDRTTGVVTYKVPVGGILNLSNTVIESQNIRGQVNFTQTWNRHRIIALAGSEIRETRTKGSSNVIYGYDDNTLVTGNVDLTTSYPTFISGSFSNIPGGVSLTDQLNRFVSFFGNAAYIFNNKYTFSISGRRDASNLFGVNTNNKWNPLWSVGGAWELSNESFYHLAYLPYLKFRATYGYSGNTDPSRTGVVTLVLNSPSAPSNLPSSRVTQFPNPDLRWERTKTINIGLDFQTRGQILTGTIEAFKKKGIDLYGAAPIDPTAGLNGQSSIIKNVANMEGKGVDITINIKNLDKSIKWYSTLLFSYNTNETTNYFVDSNLRSGNFISSGNLINPLVGQPLYSIISFKWAGLDANGNPQGYKGKDVSIDYSTITQQTKKEDLVYKSAMPTVFGNLINTFTWKGLGLAVNISYRLGYHFLKPSLSYSSLYSSGADIGSSDYSKRWQNPGDETTTNVPSLIYPANGSRDLLYNYSEVNVLKADNVKLQYINLSYDLGRRLLSKARLQQFQLYINASNLGILWKANKEDIDPDYISSPVIGKTYAIGIRATF